MACQEDDQNDPIVVSDMAWADTWVNANYLPLKAAALYRSVCGSYINHRGQSKIRQVDVSDVRDLFKFLLLDGIKQQLVRQMPISEYAAQDTICFETLEQRSDAFDSLVKGREKKKRRKK